MTDSELLKLAAKAAGIPAHEMHNTTGDNGGIEAYGWNPLTDDGEALQLAVKLDLLWRDIYDYEPFEYEADPYAATRRAIVRAAAEIGRMKGEK